MYKQVISMLLLIIFFFSHDTLFCISFAAEVLRAYGQSFNLSTCLKRMCVHATAHDLMRQV
jgi:hypothetical protein